MTTTRKSSIDFTDLDDFDGVETITQSVEQSVEDWSNRSSSSQGAIYEENCKDCRGSGKFYSYAGRYVGPCFKCKGTGKLQFRTSPESRAAARATAAKKRNEKKAAKTEQQVTKFAAWCAEHPAEYAFLDEGRKWSEFYRSLMEGLIRFGSLTDNQMAAVHQGIEKAEQRKATAPDQPETGLDLSPLPSGYYAVPNGDTRLKVRVNRPGKQSNWHGWTFVSDGAEYGQRQNYGRQGPGKLYNGKIVDQLKTIMANPAEASMAYGKLVGCCGVCGRKLEDEDSVARGIGPVCADKMGW